MWRWVTTRGLVLTAVLSLFAPGLLAQTTDLIASLDLPDPAAVHSGEVLIKGFAIDPVGTNINKIELYVDDQFQYPTLRNLPRIDIIEAFPNYPGIHNIAPGFQIGFNSARFSNGPHTVYVKVYTNDNRVFELGRRTINIDNTLNQPPFGFVDIPDPGAAYNASSSFPVLGWVTDTDGISHVDVQIDNGSMQEVMYGDSRPDVFLAYPDLPTSLYSGFIANIDSTRLQDGVHSLTVFATDRQGTRRQIGRRTIQILNAITTTKPFGMIDEPKRDAVLFGSQCGTIPIISPIPLNPQSHITPVRGWALDTAPRGDVGRVSYIELMIDGVSWISTDDCTYVPLFGAFANCYGLPRYDVERLYPNYPDSPRAGFAFTLDVGALLALGVRPGNHVLKIRVADQQGTISELPSRDGIPVFFQCADVNFIASYGFIDIPAPSDYMRGTVVFQGWALTDAGPPAAVDVIIDGDRMGAAQIGFPRTDVAQQYPQINFSVNSGWHFTMDTTKLVNGRHRLTVRAYDAGGNKYEIASQDFYTANLQ